jgi:hypothetical protein
MSRFSNLSSNDYYRNGGNNNDRNKQNNWSNNMSERRERVPVTTSKNLFERFKKEVIKAPSMTSTEFPHFGTGTFTKHEDKTSTEFLTKTMTKTPILPAVKKKAYDENTNFENLSGWIVLKGTGEKDIDNSMYDDYQDETHLTFSALKRLCIKNNHNNVRLYSCTLDGMFNYAYVLPDMDNDEYDTYVAPDYEIFNYFPKQKLIEDNDDIDYGNIDYGNIDYGNISE